jgi:hypothetical protein
VCSVMGGVSSSELRSIGDGNESMDKEEDGDDNLHS